MIRIGICDDEEIYRKHVRRLCESYFEEYPQHYECVEFSSGEEVLAYEGEMMHLLFLDVEMGGISGIEVLKKIEREDWVWRVVFISSHQEAVWNAFSIKTLEFARKPVKYEQVENWIHIAMRENKENIVYEFDTMDGKLLKAIGDIYYLEAAKNYTVLYGKKEKWLINNNLKNWEKEMKDAPMLRIHRSYLVNMEHIKKLQTQKVELENDEEIPIGRQFSKEAKQIYCEYIKKHILRWV